MTDVKEYKAKGVSTYCCNTKLAEEVTKMCNDMLAKGFVYVDTIASIQEMSAVLLFAKK